MSEEIQIDSDYKKAFNLGYDLAKELSLKVPMFKNQNPNNSPTNPMQAGIMQYIGELTMSKNKSIDNKIEENQINLEKITKGKGNIL